MVHHVVEKGLALMVCSDLVVVTFVAQMHLVLVVYHYFYGGRSCFGGMFRSGDGDLCCTDGSCACGVLCCGEKSCFGEMLCSGDGDLCCTDGSCAGGVSCCVGMWYV